MKKELISGWLKIAAGLFVFAYGVHLTISASIGLAPWDCLGAGIAGHTPMNYGQVMTIISVGILIIDLLLHESIGFGTIIDAVCTGNFTQFFNTYDPIGKIVTEQANAAGNVFSAQRLAVSLAVFFCGLLFMSFGMFLYMRCAQGCGPRDSLLVALGKRLPNVPIGAVQFGILGIVLLIGFLLGGSVGIGTLAATFGFGPVMQWVFERLHFDPRDIRNRDVVETVKLIMEG